VTRNGRMLAHDEIDGALSSWAAELDAGPAVEVLVRAGIPAGVVRDPRTMPLHPQLCQLHYFYDVEHPVVGWHKVNSLPFRYGSGVDWVRAPAPLLGQHNGEVLAGLLGVDAAELSSLEASGVIGSLPVGVEG
jgi:crotonobetainyl-CoA:carnitine CoA-transferase CaiB-like acyl-CoA transferase